MTQTEILPDPPHRIGWALAALVVAGNMIGSGVYLLPATLAPTGSSSIIGWLICGVGAVTLALVFGAGMSMAHAAAPAAAQPDALQTTADTPATDALAAPASPDPHSTPRSP